jgi:hypothetical protein
MRFSVRTVGDEEKQNDAKNKDLHESSLYPKAGVSAT